MSATFTRPVFRRKSNLFVTTNKFGEGHIPKGASDQVGPGSYDIEPSKRRSSSKNKEQSYRARLIFDLIRTKRQSDSNSKTTNVDIGRDLNEITLRLGCKKIPQVRKCNMARAPRFSKNEDDDKPGPGTYGNYYEKYEKKKFFRRCYQDFNVKMNIDRSLNLKQVSDLAPGMYDVNDKFCKKTSAVSWMDSNATLKSIWTDARDYLQSPGQYNIKSGIDELLSKNRYLGYFKKAPRFPNKHYERIMLDDICHAPRDPDEPGPAHYLPHFATCKRAPRNFNAGLFQSNRKTVAFNSTSKRDTSFINNSVEQQFQPGPGRYYPELVDKDVNSYQSAFLSKGRFQTNKQFMSFRERIKSSSTRHIPECRLEDAYCCLG